MSRWKRWTQPLATLLLGVALGVGGLPLVQTASAAPAKSRQAAAKKAVPKKAVVRKAGAKRKRVALAPRRVASAAAVATVATQLGLGVESDPLNLSSKVALVLDQKTREVLFSKNERVPLPIASLTKLMTGLVVVDAKLPLHEEITITSDDIDTLKNSGSRLVVGSRLTRGEALRLALMSSENRAAHALGRTFPGGLQRFVRLMNEKANQLGMRHTHYVEPTGLSSDNRASARDLALLVASAYQRPLLRDYSTSVDYQVDVGQRVLQYRNSNRLIDRADWDIGLQKTGYISEAGRCLVMQASVAGRQLIMVFLDASNTAARLGDAERVRRWVETTSHAARRSTTRNG